MEKIACIVLIVLMGTGCTYQRQYKPKSVGMPEAVYYAKTIGYYYTPSIAICIFQAPGYAKPAGQAASLALYRELRRHNPAANLVLNEVSVPEDPEQLSLFMREKRYDMLVTGQILTYLDGGRSTRSRVEENLLLYGLVGDRVQAIGFATAVETAPPLESTDYVIIQGRGAAALSAATLLERNSAKFALLINGMLAGESP